MKKVLVLGDGLLGSEIVKQTDWPFISRKKDKFDFSQFNSYVCFIYEYDVIINCIANTDTYSGNPAEHWNTNYVGVIHLSDYCSRMNKKLVHISTDYIYSGSEHRATETSVPVHPANWYSYTKLLGDAYVQAACNKYLLIRTSFKPKPFPYKEALVSQIGNFCYVDEIADLIIRLVKTDAQGVFNVGSKNIRNIFALALETCPEIIPTAMRIHETMPTDVSMSCDKLYNYLEENK